LFRINSPFQFLHISLLSPAATYAIEHSLKLPERIGRAVSGRNQNLSMLPTGSLVKILESKQAHLISLWHWLRSSTRFLAAEENLVTPYRFGVYDILVLLLPICSRKRSFLMNSRSYRLRSHTAEWCDIIPHFVIVQLLNLELESTGEPLLKFFDTKYVQPSLMHFYFNFCSPSCR
jgi:hypothetical protein